MSDNQVELKNYIVLDLENPNSKSDSICSFAMLKVKDNKIISKENILINPEDRFDKINMGINKITPNMVKNAITFDKLWPKVNNLIENNIIVGHGIHSDLSLISKALLRYGIKIPTFNAICTCNLAMKHLDIEKYNLKAVCNHLNINLLHHHNAMSDAIASFELFNFFNNNFGIHKDDIISYKYNIKHYLKKQNKKILYNSKTHAIKLLEN